jgi:pimeloyl-ACP methyl ester carboxylesterase
LVDQYAREVEDFRFIPLKDEWGTRDSNPKDRRLRVTIGINGWLSEKNDVTRPWRALGDDTEAFALRYEMKSLLGLGKSLENLISSYAWNTIKVEILKRTVLATLWSALWPAYLLSMATAVDNPFSLARNRSEKAGEILADALINKVQGERPVTLVGYSLGARVIYSCLRSLAKRHAFGLVDTVVFIGAPVPSNRQHWEMMRTVVSGKMFNVYSENDYLLAFLYRATSIQLGVAGLQNIRDIEGVENLNLSQEVQGHMRYAKLIGKILARCGIPVIRGADGPIEEDEDVIKLSDLDKQNANLIDFDGLDNSAVQPSVSQPTTGRGPNQEQTARDRDESKTVRSHRQPGPSGSGVVRPSFRPLTHGPETSQLSPSSVTGITSPATTKPALLRAFHFRAGYL